MSQPRRRFPVVIEGDTALIGSAAELAIALDVLHGTRDRAILEQLRPHLSAVVADPQGFLLVMRSLAPTDQRWLVEALGPALVTTIGHARALRDILASLAAHDVEHAILSTLGRDGLRTLLTTPRDVAHVLEWIYGHTDVELIRLVGTDHIRRLVKTGSELSLILSALEPAAGRDLLETFGPETVRSLLRTSADLAALVRALPAEASHALLAGLERDALVALIGNAQDWSTLYGRLEPAEASLLARTLGVDDAA